MGLNDEEVLKKTKKYGSNVITMSRNNSFLKPYITTLGDPIIRILLIALAIKTIFLIKQFDWYETIGIVIAIFLASFISTISEYGSEKAFIKLQEESSKIKCKLLRNNKKVEANIDDVVVGDVVILEAGDRIPADGVIIDGEVVVDESSITGENKEIYKNTLNKDVLRGTVVYSKTAKMLVTKVGNNTFYGEISAELQQSQPESPLKIRLRSLAQIISKIGYIGAFLVFISHMVSVIFIKNNFDISLIKMTVTNIPYMIGEILYGITLCITVIVVAVPEGLPMMITLVLSSNMKRMLKKNVLVRKLVGIETAGSINILFSDKTGTITKGKLEVTTFITPNLKEHHNINNLDEIVAISLAYNNASFYDGDNIVGGNITDRAILKFSNIKNKDKYDIIETIPFDSKNKYSATTIRYNGSELFLIKGAPEIILEKCRYKYDMGKKVLLNTRIPINEFIEKYTSLGNRIIAFAMADSSNDLTLVGFALIKDEIRSEAKKAIQLVKDANIQIVMVTGDNKDTALAIAKEAELYSDGDLVLTSDEMKKMSDAYLKAHLKDLRIVARAIPQDKSRLVRIAQELDLVVGMTGDGVNDAPALKRADVGFAFGKGAEVAKEASEIVILDNNFLSIAQAILFGRTIFKSIRKFIIFQLTVNMCAVSLSVIGPFIGVETPVTVIQMLWINMVMDTLAAIAFAYEPPLLEYMEEKPKKRDENIINKYMFHEIFFTGIYSTLLCILFLKLPFISGMFGDKLLTAFFGLFIFMGIFNSFNARTHRLNLLSHLKQNKAFIIVISFIVVVQILLIYYGGNLFRTIGLSFKEFQIMFILSMTVIPVDFLRKYILRKNGIMGGV